MKYHFTPEQADLIASCLAYARSDMNKTNTIDSNIAAAGKEYCARRITEILAKFEAPSPFAVLPDDLPVPAPESFELEKSE